MIKEEKKCFSFAFLETTQSNVILEFRLSHSAFWDLCKICWGQCVDVPRCLVSFQARTAENPYRMPSECKKKHTWCVRVCYTCTCLYLHTYLSIYICMYVCQAKDLNSCFQCEIHLGYCTTRQDRSAKRLESIFHTSLTRKTRRPSSSPFLIFSAWIFLYLNTCTCNPLLTFTVMPCCFFCASLQVL